MALTYVLPTPVFGAQASFALLGAYGRVDTTLDAQVSGTLSATAGGVPLGSLLFSRSDMINDTLWGLETSFHFLHCAGTRASTTTWSTSQGTCRSGPTTRAVCPMSASGMGRWMA